MDGTDNDRTIGASNRGTAKPTSASQAVQPRPNEGALMVAVASGEGSSLRSVSASTATVALGGNITGGGVFDWPTSADQYQLVNIVGQGAFASVWRARIIGNTTSGGEGEKLEGEEGAGEGVQCAIKIMDLEHVNINISGEFRNLSRNINCRSLCWLPALRIGK